MDQQVQRDDDPGHSGAAKKLGVAQNSGSAMVVAVEESWRQDESDVGVNWIRRLQGMTRTQRLLLEEEEDSIEELEILGKVVQLIGQNVSFIAPPGLEPGNRATGTARRTYIVQNDQRLGPAASMIADGKKDTLAHDGRQNLLDK